MQQTTDGSVQALAMPVSEPSVVEGREPEAGMALCLSGGGYRAMIFHLGALWRLYDAGLLGKLKRISSVSGGSITAAVLGLKWARLSFSPGSAASEFVPHVVTPLRNLARRTIDVPAVIGGVLLPGTVAGRIAGHYRRHLYGNATLQDLPAGEPRFIINATNVQSGALWRFSRPYMGDWRVGRVIDPRTPLADAVAASSAFPPFLSPITLDLHAERFAPGDGAELRRPPFTSTVVLSDGGVYDNLGLETAYKRYRTILVSDAGGALVAEEKPKRDWSRHAYRALMLIDNQVRSLRKRQLIGAFRRGERSGAYWGIRTDLEDYGLAAVLPVERAAAQALGSLATRMKRIDDATQERLINWGYAVCDAALRAHVDNALPMGEYPYQRGV